MKNKSDVIVALLVILCSIVLLTALIFSIAGNPLRRPPLQFSVDFIDVTGIKANSDVLYAGDKVGVVDMVEHLAPGDRITDDHTVRAHISILEELPLPANLDIIISAESMLGEKHIALKRVDDAGGLLADGANLTSSSTGSMVEMLLPGGEDIVANVSDITTSLKEFTERLSKGEAGKKVTDTLTNIQELTDTLKLALAGDEDTEGITDKFDTLADNLKDTTEDIKELISGAEGAEDEGLAARGKVIFANLQNFSEELNHTIAGGPDGDPGLRDRLNDITDEVHALLAGKPGTSEEGLRKRADAIMTKVETLVEEINALVVWGEYITGTLAEKPNRIIFGNKENDVPTKEQIIEFLRKHEEPYPVRIKENDPRGDPAVPVGAGAPPGEMPQVAPQPEKKGGLFKFKSRRDRE